MAKSSSGTSAAKIALQLQKLSNEATEKSFKYNTQEANTAREWQKMMSDTSHQREVKDLVKAGLNPILSSGGSGAQSYTTSSASAQAENAAGAVGNVWSSQISADATRAAAAQSAAATRYAAAQQASAARYAAAMQYQTQADSWKWKTDYMKEEYKQKINLANSTPTSSIGGVMDKIAQKSGLYDLVGTKAVKSVVSNLKGLLNNPSKYFDPNKDGKITKNDFKLNGQGTQFINKQLYKLGIRDNARTRNLFVRAVVFRDSKAAVQLSAYVPKPKKVKSPTSTSSTTSNHKYKGMQM